MKTLLFFLLCVTGFTAFVSGVLLVVRPDGSLLQLPASLLETTPFRHYLIPGLLLGGVVGGSSLMAVFLLMSKQEGRYSWSLAAGALLTGWITLQVILIQSLHWLHMVFFLTGVLVMLLAYQLKGKWAV